MSADPTHIMTAAMGYGVSRALLAAVGMGLYTRLAEGPMRLDEVVSEFALVRRPAMDFLDLLVSVNLLSRDGDGEAALYGNTGDTAIFLVRGSPHYIGGILELWDKRNYRYWDGLEDGLKHGRAQNETRSSDKSFFAKLYEEPERLEAFMNAMEASSRANFEALAQAFAFERHASLADIGGANALLTRIVAAAHPHLSCISFDLPAVTDIAARKIAADGLSDRVEAVAGDFFADPLPRADVITMGMILHDWNLEKKKLLIARAYDALPEGGALIAVESLIDDARRTNTFGLFMSLTMLIEFGDAFDYTGSEFEAWCLEAGFSRCEIVPLAGPSSAAIAYK